MSNNDELKAPHEFDSMNELENNLRFETRKECMNIIKDKIQNGESELYRSLFIDGILPYEPRRTRYPFTWKPEVAHPNWRSAS